MLTKNESLTFKKKKVNYDRGFCGNKNHAKNIHFLLIVFGSNFGYSMVRHL